MKHRLSLPLPTSYCHNLLWGTLRPCIFMMGELFILYPLVFLCCSGTAFLNQLSRQRSGDKNLSWQKRILTKICRHQEQAELDPNPSMLSYTQASTLLPLVMLLERTRYHQHCKNTKYFSVMYHHSKNALIHSYQVPPLLILLPPPTSDPNSQTETDCRVHRAQSLLWAAGWPMWREAPVTQYCIFCNKFQYQVSKCFTEKVSIFFPILQMGIEERDRDFCTITARLRKGIRGRFFWMYRSDQHIAFWFLFSCGPRGFHHLKGTVEWRTTWHQNCCFLLKAISYGHMLEFSTE